MSVDISHKSRLIISSGGAPSPWTVCERIRGFPAWIRGPVPFRHRIAGSQSWRTQSKFLRMLLPPLSMMQSGEIQFKSTASIGSNHYITGFSRVSHTNSTSRDQRINACGEVSQYYAIAHPTISLELAIIHVLSVRRNLRRSTNDVAL